jgi:hypothetical protein
MASIVIPQPGTKRGPCIDCDHIDCQHQRDIAASICRLCGCEIGHGKGLFRDDYENQYIHETCLEHNIMSQDRAW